MIKKEGHNQVIFGLTTQPVNNNGSDDDTS